MTVTKKYPNAYFKVKDCKACGISFQPITPAELYCCKECRGKNSYYKRNYGINDAILKQMKEDQNNCCAICGSKGFFINKNNSTELLAVDHDHNTGKVRELLCHNCNRGLGLFQDNFVLLKKAAAYLQKHSDRKLIWSEYVDN
jgi:Recombination endonuclease VII